MTSSPYLRKYMNDLERFYNKTKREEWKRNPELELPCLKWTGWKIFGYGGFKVGSKKDGTRKNVRAHRWIYQQLVGPIPDGYEPDHLCRQTDCVELTHLEIVTHQVNVLRGTSLSAFNAKKTHCYKGHPFDVENTYVCSRGLRNCRACRRVAAMKSYYKVKGAA